MHPQPQRVLAQMIARYGAELLDQPERVDALLADLAGSYHRERFLLVHALRERIPSDLMAQPNGGAGHWQRLSQRLQTRYGFSSEAADWAVESWALALNLAPFTSRLPAPLASLLGLMRRPAPWASRGDRRGSAVTGKKRQNRVQYQRNGTGLPLRLLLAVLLTVASVVTVGRIIADPVRTMWANRTLAWQAPADVDVWQAPSLEQATAQLLEMLQPPQEARIEADLLNVRESPSVEAPVTGMVGPLGAMVTVDAFSEDGQWAHIASPVAGWVSNEFASYALQDPTSRLFLGPEIVRIQVAGAPVFSSSHGSEIVPATLVADQIVIVLGVSIDRSRMLISEPVLGWIDADIVQR